jgi:hypothetical protein
MLDRLVGHPRRGDTAYDDLAPLVADLEADRDKPTEVDRLRRAVHLVPAAAALAGPLTLAFWLALPTHPALPERLSRLLHEIGLGHAPHIAAGVALALAAAWVAWGMLTRGGWLLGLAGLIVVRGDSRPAERWRCGLRALACWAPVALLLALACWARSRGLDTASWSCWVLGLGLTLSYPLFALVWPSRSLHDRLAGTALVPE